jgi:hypothetical protein
MSDKIDIEAFERWVFNAPNEGARLGPFQLLELLKEEKLDEQTQRRLLEICSQAKRLERAKLDADERGSGSFKLTAILEIEETLRRKRQ